MLACARGLYGGIERQDIGLKSNCINRANDLGHAPGAALNGFDRIDGLVHHHHARIHAGAHVLCLLLGGGGSLGIVLHGGGDLLHAGHGLHHIAGLLVGAFGQQLIVLQQSGSRVRHQGGIAEHIGHHAGQGNHHFVQQLRHLRQLIAPLGLDPHRQVARRGLGHGPGQLPQLLHQHRLKSPEHIQKKRPCAQHHPQGRQRRQRLDGPSSARHAAQPQHADQGKLATQAQTL